MSAHDLQDRLRQDLPIWHLDGEIDVVTLNLLKERYRAEAFGWAGVVRYLGIAGGLVTLFGILGLVCAMSGSGAFGALVLGATGGAMTWWGMRLSGDLANRYAVSSKMLITLGCVQWQGALLMLAHLCGMSSATAVVVTGALGLPIVFLLAYGTRTVFLLILGLIGLFHWIGSWNGMSGRSSYAFSVQDPRLMSVAALLAVAVGMFHERRLHPRTGRFFVVWEVMGLLYLNMSLLILSIWSPPEGSTLVWMVALGLAALAQIILGARWQNGVFTGFGITFLAINLFTRYHELIGKDLPPDRYLMFAGAAVVVVAVMVEVVIRWFRRQEVLP